MPLLYRARQVPRRGFSLLELLAILLLISIIAAIAVPRISNSSTVAKEAVDKQNRAEINTSVEHWFINNGSWPKSDLTDIGADASYFPDGLPTNPVTGDPYELDVLDHRVK